MTLLTYIGLERTNSIDNGIKSATRALTASVDEQITSIQSSLKILAAIEDFDEPNLRKLHGRLRKFVKNQDGWSSIGLTDLSGEHIFTTIKNFGEYAPHWRDEGFFQRTLKSKKMEVSNFRIARLTKKKVFSATVPVFVGKEVKYILIATVFTDVLSKKLREQNFPKTWTASILDKNGVILARSRDHRKFSGNKATKALRDKINSQRDNLFEATSQEGIDSYGAYHHTKNAPWTVVLAMPESEAKLPYLSLLLIFIVGGGLLLGSGIYLVLKFSRKIATSVTNLSLAARAFGKGERPEHYDYKLIEINEVFQSIEKAASDREKLDKTNAELLKKSQEAVEVRDNFLSVASHELKTPLTSISLQTQILKRILENKENISSEKLNQSVKRIFSQLKRLTQLIDDLLDVTRIQAGHLDVNPEKVNIYDLIADVKDQFQEENRDIKFSISGDRVEAFLDPNRMEQVFTNLLSNAVKYGNRNPIHIVVKDENTLAKIEIKDHGLGLLPEETEKIFERFERVGNKAEISGMGLGLWIVKKIINESNGKIEVVSAGPGLGCTFVVTLPINGKESI